MAPLAPAEEAALPRTIAYGPAPHQVGDLYLPAREGAPVVVLLHGGFWRLPFGRDQMNAVARDLQARGYAVWNVGYHCAGEGTIGWPRTFDDVRAAIAHLAQLPDEMVDAANVVVCGHSAGGHLALWVAAQHRELAGVRIRAAVSLAGIGDLARAHVLGLGRNSVEALLGAPPAYVPDRYAMASPAALLPIGVRQLLLHGVDDDIVPVSLARAYARVALGAGDEVEMRELPDCGHSEFLDPTTPAHLALCSWLERLPVS